MDYRRLLSTGFVVPRFIAIVQDLGLPNGYDRAAGRALWPAADAAVSLPGRRISVAAGE